jgi:Tfp pilus assembly protein PilX
MEKTTPVLNNKEGSIILVVMIVSFLLTTFGLSAIKTSKIELHASGNEKKFNMAFYAAESGIEVGRAVLHELKSADRGNWDNLLAGNSLVGQSNGVTTLDQIIAADGGGSAGGASFSLAVQDNSDLDGSTQVDTDNTIILTATGTFRNAEVEIETTVHYTGGNDRFAQEHYDTTSSGNAADESAAAANQIRFGNE